MSLHLHLGLKNLAVGWSEIGTPIYKSKIEDQRSNVPSSYNMLVADITLKLKSSEFSSELFPLQDTV